MRTGSPRGLGHAGKAVPRAFGPDSTSLRTDGDSGSLPSGPRGVMSTLA